VKFRTWLDAARLLLLLVCHIGIAASFVIWNPTISCPGDSGSLCYYSDTFLLIDIQAPDSRICRLLNVYIIVASWVPPLPRELNSLNARLHLTTISQVILYGIGLATYAWRYASNPTQYLADDPEETSRGIQPSLLRDPVTETWDSSSTRHLSELMLSPPSTSVLDPRRESGRKSRLEKQRIF